MTHGKTRDIGIDPARMYTRAAIKDLMGWSYNVLSKAQKNGLKVTYAHRRAFYRGSDLIEYVTRNGTDRYPCQAAG